jgi:hypothetical protein
MGAGKIWIQLQGLAIQRQSLPPHAHFSQGIGMRTLIIGIALIPRAQLTE